MPKREMPRAAKQLLKVYPNPYKLDHEGRPAGALLFDPVDHHAYGNDEEQRRYVGAERIWDEVKPASKYAPAVLEHGFSFEFAIVSLPDTRYYREHIRTGDIIAADVATWKLAGGDPKHFRDPLTRLAEAKTSAIGHHVREHGDGSVLQSTHDHWAEHLTPAAAPSEHAAPKSAPALAEPDEAPAHAEGDV